jgi:hypothetical protein
MVAPGPNASAKMPQQRMKKGKIPPFPTSAVACGFKKVIFIRLTFFAWPPPTLI